MAADSTKYIWFNGKMVPWADAKVHVTAHALHYGSAVFEGIRAYKTSKGPQIFRLRNRRHPEKQKRVPGAYRLRPGNKRFNKALRQGCQGARGAQGQLGAGVRYEPDWFDDREPAGLVYFPSAGVGCADYHFHGEEERY